MHNVCDNDRIYSKIFTKRINGIGIKEEKLLFKILGRITFVNGLSNIPQLKEDLKIV
jgi:hypothetical protein